MKQTSFVLFFYIVCLNFVASSLAVAQSTYSNQSDTNYLKKTLIQKKFSKDFIKQLLKNYDTESFDSTLRLNLLGFLNPPSHAVQVTDEGVFKSEEFIKANQAIFNSTYKTDHVPASVISSLLWIETKHGKLTGRYHVPSVYLHLLQAQRKEVQSMLTQKALSIDRQKKISNKKIKKLIPIRCKDKSKWALEQLKALEKIYKKDKNLVLNLEGSFAGAFGIPQFIPTSYLTYAKSYKKNKVADLYLPEDAIASVSNYLKKTGWNNKNKSKKMKALMHYNNSQDYAESILDLSKRIILNKKMN